MKTLSQFLTEAKFPMLSASKDPSIDQFTNILDDAGYTELDANTWDPHKGSFSAQKQYVVLETPASITVDKKPMWHLNISTGSDHWHIDFYSDGSVCHIMDCDANTGKSKDSANCHINNRTPEDIKDANRLLKELYKQI